MLAAVVVLIGNITFGVLHFQQLVSMAFCTLMRVSCRRTKPLWRCSLYYCVFHIAVSANFTLRLRFLLKRSVGKILGRLQSVFFLLDGELGRCELWRVTSTYTEPKAIINESLHGNRINNLNWI